VTPGDTGQRRKDALMWIYDGEEWIEEGSKETDESERTSRSEDEFIPEMQVIEIVPTPAHHPVPPLPMP
jgi:hypothetical protein